MWVWLNTEFAPDDDDMVLLESWIWNLKFLSLEFLEHKYSIKNT